MNFLNKKILLGIVVIVLLIIAGGIGAIFYWQKTHISLDISSEAVKSKCLENVSKMTDEELINEVKNLKYSDEIDPFSGKERMTSALGQITKYLICRMKYNRNSDFYNKAKSFIEELAIESFIQEENKQIFLAALDKTFELESSFAKMLALSPLEAICSDNEEKDEFLELCLGNVESVKNEFSLEKVEGMIDSCKGKCDKINKYIDDIPLFENDLNNTFVWSNNIVLARRQTYGRVALAFRLGGKELALKACSYVPNLEIKEECQKYADSLDYMKNCKKFDYGGTKDCEIYEECAEIRQGIINLVCEFDL